MASPRSPRLKPLYLRPANNGVDFRSRFQTFGLPDDTAFHSHVVSIEKNDEIASGLPERLIPCSSRSAILKESALLLNQSFTFKFCDDLP